MSDEEKCCNCFHWRTQTVWVEWGYGLFESEMYACALGGLSYPYDSCCQWETRFPEDSDYAPPCDDDEFSDFIRMFTEKVLMKG